MHENVVTLNIYLLLLLSEPADGLFLLLFELCLRNWLTCFYLIND